MDEFEMLREVVNKGGPAQARHAKTLLDQLDQEIDVSENVQQLYNAYINDPYLTRNP
ncbi:MAG: hypothetical protein K0U42_05175 [Actinomycetia bacterium]|jgi:hypothetical protein|nr:hypothetical protein [Actinomycetes bacterium]MCH9738132.1 hypothetical protein [Actinomycetes bacterium]MCH9831230.1 hypothetical protein [Actinomycetes bacterium]MCH9839788.1 hypothetical protein [Actinomycetes bacterium]